MRRLDRWKIRSAMAGHAEPAAKAIAPAPATEILDALCHGYGMTDPLPHILIVDDERDIREGLAAYLRREGCRVSVAADAARAREILAVHPVSLVLLDIMMPGEDGLSLTDFIRATLSIPIILVTARTQEGDRIKGLDAGGDDYVSKPFSPKELHARIRAVLRRVGNSNLVQGAGSGGYAFGSWVLRVAKRELVDGQCVVTPLSSSEFNLLHALVTHPNRVLSREQLLDLSQGEHAVSFDRSIDNKVSRLRRKLETAPGAPTPIKTIWGGGYMFEAEVRAL